MPNYLYDFSKLGWRLGLQAVTVVLVLAFFLSAVYRSASLYHPQRRAILHLKNQRRKVINTFSFNSHLFIHKKSVKFKIYFLI